MPAVVPTEDPYGHRVIATVERDLQRRYPEAETDVETQAIRLALVREALAGQSISHDVIISQDPPRGLALLQGDERLVFQKSASHLCVGRPVGEETELAYTITNNSSNCCTFARFDPNDVFYHLDGQRYRATGDVFVCCRYGVGHLCTEATCTRQALKPHQEGKLCELTLREFRQHIISETHDPDAGGDPEHPTTGQGRDGGLSYSNRRSGGSSGGGGAGGGGGGGRGTNFYRRRGQNQRNKSSRTLELEQLALAALCDADCRLFLVQLPDNGGVRALIDVHLPRISPQVPPPLLNKDSSSTLDVYIPLLLYDNTVREHVMQKLTHAEYQMTNVINYYYQRCYKANLRRDPMVVATVVANALRPHYERLCSMGILPPMRRPYIDRYFREAVICVWKLLYYTPYARRFLTSLSLKRHIGGIMYKLQVGFCVRVEYELATGLIVSTRPFQSRPCPPGNALIDVHFVPGHRFLNCMPQKNDINHTDVFRRRGIRSDQIVETDKLITSCFGSVIDQAGATVEMASQFCLDRYLQLMDCAAASNQY
jgi:hypothetical protein